MLPVVPDRITWAVELLDPRPADRILEIGCGPGLAAALVCERLAGGRLTAIDRSATATERARWRLAAHPATVEHTDLAGLTAAAATFDKAFAVNVNVFWTGPADAELAVLRRVVRPGGVVHLVYEGPAGVDRDVAPTVATALERIGCAVEVRRRPSAGLLGVAGVLP